MTNATNGWREWSKYVLKELEHNRADHDKMLDLLNEIDKRVAAMDNEVAALQVKAGVWGLIAGTIPVVAAILLNMIK